MRRATSEFVWSDLKEGIIVRTRIISKAGWALLVTLLLAGIAYTCPPGSIAGTGDMVMTPFGPVIVESCVTESGGTTTFTYQITSVARGPLGLCGFQIPGLGAFTTTSTSEPLGLTGSITEASGCATWWIWKGSGTEILPGGLATFSISVDAPATPTTREAFLTFCDGTKESVDVLAPSACADITDDPYAGCFCGEGSLPCESTESFEGEGTRINMLGLDRQVLAVCSASWVRHGWSFGIEDVDRYDFSLDIDGVPVDLKQRIFCVPGEIAGGAHLASQWFVQFPPEYFEAGRMYGFVASWLDYGAGPAVSVIFSRRVEVQVLPCLVPVPLPPLSPLLPDLVVEIGELACECAWTPQQKLECRLSIPVLVTNEGERASKKTSLRVAVERDTTVRSIPELAPSEEFELTIKATVEADPGLTGPCSLEVEAEVDFSHVVEESNEENNTDTACCQ
ncbi:MAG: CARDB domain-containing protein, partial [Candidatus Bipolaricaulia bacterium]